MSQSLQSQPHQLLPQGGNEHEGKTIETSLLKLVGNTLIFGNTVYQLRNISSVTLIDLSRTETYAPKVRVPVWYWYLVAFGAFLLFVYGIGIYILGYAGWLFWQHSQLRKTRKVEKFGLKLVMNSGESMILTSKSKDFVLSIILNIFSILNSEVPKAVTFNFETLRIEHQSINIGQNYYSSFVSGQVSGDVVNNLCI